MNRPHFRRRGRAWRESTRIDPLHELLPCPICDPEATLPTLPTRYDAEWPSVLAAERPGDEWSSLPPVFAPHTFAGGDLPAMAAPADWPVWDYGEGYEIEPEERAVVHHGSVAGCPLCAEPVEPHGRHRQTDPLDLLLADLRDIEDRLS